MGVKSLRSGAGRVVTSPVPSSGAWRGGAGPVSAPRSARRRMTRAGLIVLPLAVLGGLVFVGPSGTESPRAAGPADEETQVGLVRSFLAAWNTDDVEATLGFFAADAVVVTHAASPRFRGPRPRARGRSGRGCGVCAAGATGWSRRTTGPPAPPSPGRTASRWSAGGSASPRGGRPRSSRGARSRGSRCSPCRTPPRPWPVRRPGRSAGRHRGPRPGAAPADAGPWRGRSRGAGRPPRRGGLVGAAPRPVVRGAAGPGDPLHRRDAGVAGGAEPAGPPDAAGRALARRPRGAARRGRPAGPAPPPARGAVATHRPAGRFRFGG